MLCPCLRGRAHIWGAPGLQAAQRSRFLPHSKESKRFVSFSSQDADKSVIFGVGEDRDLPCLGSKLLKCNKLHSKKTRACLNSSTPHFPVSSEQAHCKKSMFSPYTDCIKSTDMQGWGKLTGRCCQLCCACLNEDQDLVEKK